MDTDDPRFLSRVIDWALCDLADRAAAAGVGTSWVQELLTGVDVPRGVSPTSYIVGACNRAWTHYLARCSQDVE